MFCSLAFNFKHGADSLQCSVGCGALNWQNCSFYILSNPFIGFHALTLQIFVMIIKRSGREVFQTNETSNFFILFFFQSMICSWSSHYLFHKKPGSLDIMKLPRKPWYKVLRNLVLTEVTKQQIWQKATTREKISLWEGRKLKGLVH